MATDALRAELLLEANQALNSLNKFFNEAEKGATSTGKSVGSNLTKNIESEVKNLKIGDIIQANIVSGFALDAVRSGVQGIAGIIGTAFGKSQELTKLGLKYEVLLGSQEEAAKRQQEILKYAATTPFEVGEITQADTVLQSFGIRSEKLLKNLGNASAISGKGFSDLSLIIGQISQSKSVGNLNQLFQSGILGKQDLIKAGVKFDLKTGEVENSVDELYTAVNNIIEKKFAGGTDKINNFLSGQLSTINDNLTQAFDTIFKGSGLEKILLDTAFGINAAFATIDLKPFANGLKVVFDTLKKIDPNILIAGITGIGGAFAVAFGSIAIPALISFAVAAAPFLVIAAGVAGVALLIQQNWSTLGPIFDSVKNTILGFVDTAKNSSGELTNIFNTGGGNTDNTQKLLKSLGISDQLSTQITGVLSGILGNAKGSFTELKRLFEDGSSEGQSTTKLLKSLGLSDETTSQVLSTTGRIVSSIKPAFAELQTSLSGNANGSNAGLAKLLGIDEAQANTINDIIARISQTIQALPATLGTAFNTVKQFFVDTFNNPIVQAGINSIIVSFTTLLLPALQELGNTITTLFLPVLTQVFNFLGIILPPILTALGAIIGTVLVVAINVIIRLFSSLVQAINIAINVFTVIGSVVVAAFGTIVSYLSAVFQSIIAIFTGNFGALSGIWSGFLENLKTLWSNAWTTITTALGGIFNGIVSAVTAGWNLLTSYLGIAFGLLKTFWTNSWNSISSTVAGVWETIKTGVSDGINAVVEYFIGLGTKVIEIVSGIDLAAIGRSMIQTLINGITSMAGAVAGAINGLLRNVSGGAFGLPGFADGVRNFGGGLAMVGEKGFEIIKTSKGSYIANQPTLANLPRGTDVYTNAQSQRMLGGGNSPISNTTTSLRNSQNSISINNFNGIQSFNPFDTDSLTNAI